MIDRLEAENLRSLPGVRHGFFTRNGGVSDGIYATLNCGVGSCDDRPNVLENRRRVAETIGVEEGRLVTPFQIHSDSAVVATKPWVAGPDAPRADIVVTRERKLAIGILTADCAPILFVDPEAGVIAAAHAGWRGALAGVVESAVAQMEALGATRDKIRAAIGPTISQAAYEVGDEFRDTFVSADAGYAGFFAKGKADRPHFDLPGFLLSRMQAAGLQEPVDLGTCTYGDEARFFSYRRTTHRGERDYGRQISVIALTP